MTHHGQGFSNTTLKNSMGPQLGSNKVVTDKIPPCNSVKRKHNTEPVLLMAYFADKINNPV